MLATSHVLLLERSRKHLFLTLTMQAKGKITLESPPAKVAKDERVINHHACGKRPTHDNAHVLKNNPKQCVWKNASNWYIYIAAKMLNTVLFHIFFKICSSWRFFLHIHLRQPTTCHMSTFQAVVSILLKSQTNGPGKKIVLQHENGETSIRLLATELVDGMPSTAGYLGTWQPGRPCHLPAASSCFYRVHRGSP